MKHHPRHLPHGGQPLHVVADLGDIPCLDHDPSHPNSVREAYETFGVEGYYSKGAYANPHLDQVQDLLSDVLMRFQPCRVLDLGAGNGEVTSTLEPAGFDCVGLDPYLHESFELQTGKSCHKLSFQDLGRHGLQDGPFPLAVASYSLHLLEESLLPAFLWQLKVLGVEDLVVLTPHKRPDLSAFAPVSFQSETETPKGKRVRLKIYNLRELFQG